MANYLSSKELDAMIATVKAVAEELHEAIRENQEAHKALTDELRREINELRSELNAIKNSKNNAKKCFKSE